MPHFKLENLYFKYTNQKERVIENFSMELEKGEIVALLGNSGSGKSTILRLIAGLEKPSAGKLVINKKKIFDEKQSLTPQERGVGMIFQDYCLFPHLTVLQNVGFGIKSKRKNEKEKIAMNYLNLVQLHDQAEKYPSECSGGQQQRIAIARALAAEPDILLLDEPFSNLDENLRISVRKEIRDLLKKCNMSAILVTHDHNDVDAVADRVIRIT